MRRGSDKILDRAADETVAGVVTCLISAVVTAGVILLLHDDPKAAKWLATIGLSVGFAGSALLAYTLIVPLAYNSKPGILALSDLPQHRVVKAFEQAQQHSGKMKLGIVLVAASFVLQVAAVWF